MSYILIEDDAAALRALPRPGTVESIALDCEAAGFHRYSDRLCLVQLSTHRETFLLDPLAMDPREALKPLLEDPAVEVVMHGADYDLRLLDRDLGLRVRGLFDTQTASALLGAPAVGLAALLESHLGVRLSKKHQRADWARRPLPRELLDYASEDTRHLLPLAGLLSAALRERGREEWAREEFRLLEEIRWEEEEEESDPLTRVKGARELAPREAAALREALAWRDAIARGKDRAPFRVAADNVLLAAARERPSTVETLASLPGMSRRTAHRHGPELLERLRAVASLPEKEVRPYPRWNRTGPGRPTPEEEEAADRLRKLRTARAGALGVDRGVLLSNQQILEIVRSRPRSLEELLALPGARRWQMELLGPEILPLLGEGKR